ncbi:hypothetical protein [Sphingomonas sp.]|uniref:hypothetical protein n=1 Tax=Sphingomonas sp. TaxID=28214 RepID=UPI0035BC829A
MPVADASSSICSFAAISATGGGGVVSTSAVLLGSGAGAGRGAWRGGFGVTDTVGVFVGVDASGSDREQPASAIVSKAAGSSLVTKDTSYRAARA